MKNWSIKGSSSQNDGQKLVDNNFLTANAKWAVLNFHMKTTTQRRNKKILKISWSQIWRMVNLQNGPQAQM